MTPKLETLYRVGLVLFAIAPGAIASAKAESIVWQTNFQSTPLGSYTAGSILSGPENVRVVSSSVEVVGDACAAAGGTGNCLQLPPTAFSVASLDSTASFNPGNYFVQLQIAGGSTSGEVLATLGGIAGQGIFRIAASSAFANYQFFSTVPSGETSVLQISGGPALIASIQVTQIESAVPVPEPTSWMLMVSALVALGVARSRAPAANAP